MHLAKKLASALVACLRHPLALDQAELVTIYIMLAVACCVPGMGFTLPQITKTFALPLFRDTVSLSFWFSPPWTGFFYLVNLDMSAYVWTNSSYGTVIPLWCHDAVYRANSGSG